MKPWTKIYQPIKISEVIGQTLAIDKLKKSLSPSKPVLLYGQTGTGKTSAIYAIGKEQNLDIFEINSSETRNKEGIQNSLGNTIVQQSLFSRGRIILIDDVDTLSGTKDRGGLATIIFLFSKTKFPIVLTCTDPWSDKLSSLRKKCLLIEFAPIKKEEIRDYLKKICQEEKIKHNDEDLLQIAKTAQGDLRSAINDLQTHSVSQILKLEPQGERNKQEDIHYCLRKIFKSKKWDETLNIFDKVDLDINECLLWLDENLPGEYNSEDLKRAYECISKADVFNGRIMRWQYWRFLVYINILLTSGVAVSKRETNPKFPAYKRTGRILKLWIANQRNAKKKSICEKIAEATHTSKADALKNTFPYLKDILVREDIVKELDLNEEEINWLNK